MSHITTLEIEIRDLTALRAACARLGLVFAENQKTYRHYYGVGNCVHAVSSSKFQYEIGVIEEKNGTYKLAYDGWKSGGIEAVLGKDLGKLKQAYAAEATKIAARRRGFSIIEKLDGEGNIQILLRKESL